MLCDAFLFIIYSIYIAGSCFVCLFLVRKQISKLARAGTGRTEGGNDMTRATERMQSGH